MNDPSREVLLVCPDFHPAVGGYAHAGTQFATALARSGRGRVTVVTWVPLAGAPEIAQDRLSVVRLRRLPEFRYSILLDQFRLGLRLRRLIRSGPFEFILFETFENPLAQAIALWRSPALRRVAVRIHACTETEVFRFDRRPIGALNRFLQRRVARRVPNIFSTTRFYLRWFAANVLEGDVFASFKNYQLIPNCVAIDRPAAAPAGARPPSGEVTFLCLGRLNAIGYNQKNFELVAQALAILKGGRPDLYGRTRVHFVGDGERRKDFEAVLERLGVAGRCAVVPSLPNREVHALQASASACILVSRYEGLSMFGLEALANGAPLIVSRNTGASELVADGVNGYLVDHDDPFDLAAAMGRVATADVSSLRAASRRRFEEEFDPALIADRFWTSVDLCLASRK
jgi:glycosyltransferase involved in cell wall biosynthesis